LLRTALAMGADNAVLIDTASALPDSLGIARLLHGFITADSDACGLVLCGKQAIDDDIGGVAAMLAALLGWPQALNASAVEATGSSWLVTCGDDAGTATWRLGGPPVVSADLRLAEPRRVTLSSIVKANKNRCARLMPPACLQNWSTSTYSESPRRTAPVSLTSIHCSTCPSLSSTTRGRTV
jgi:electron transfer flavoprotein beta subunit